MSLLNDALRAVFDVALRPFAALPPIVPVTIVALVSGIFALLVYRWTSNQEAIAAVKRRLFGHLLEVRLFNDDLRAVLAAQLRLLRENLTYLRLNLVPLLWMIVPFMLLIAQLQFHYGYDGPQGGVDEGHGRQTDAVRRWSPGRAAASRSPPSTPRPRAGQLLLQRVGDELLHRRVARDVAVALHPRKKVLVELDLAAAEHLLSFRSSLAATPRVRGSR